MTDATKINHSNCVTNSIEEDWNPEPPTEEEIAELQKIAEFCERATFRDIEDGHVVNEPSVQSLVARPEATIRYYADWNFTKIGKIQLDNANNVDNVNFHRIQ